MSTQSKILWEIFSNWAKLSIGSNPHHKATHMLHNEGKVSLISLCHFRKAETTVLLFSQRPVKVKDGNCSLARQFEEVLITVVYYVVGSISILPFS